MNARIELTRKRWSEVRYPELGFFISMNQCSHDAMHMTRERPRQGGDGGGGGKVRDDVVTDIDRGSEGGVATEGCQPVEGG